MEAKGILAQDLKAKFSSSDDCPKELDTLLIGKFALGPSTEAGLWEGERATMTLDQGPCKLRSSV